MRVVVVLFCLVSFVAAPAQTPPDSQTRIPVPESGFVSPRQYTSAFFGFALPLPQGHHFRVEDLSESYKPLGHFLFEEKSADKGFTILIVSATPVLGSADDEALEAVFLPNMEARKTPEALSIGGRLFWKNAIEQKAFDGKKVWRRRYATIARGFVVRFWISAYNASLAEELGQAIESIKFFDPVKARETAGADSSPFLPQAARLRLQSPPDMDISSLDPGRISGTVYVNSFLGFSYRFPDSWHASGGADSKLNSIRSTADGSPQNGHQDATSAQCTRVLSSATKYPEQNRPLEFNPRITILVADPICFVPDLTFPTSLHDQPTIEAYGQALFRSFAGTRFLGDRTTKLFAADLAGHIFLQVPSMNAEPIAGSTLLRKVHTELVLTSMRKYWVIWLFESDTESELGKLMKTSISFNAPRQADEH